MNLTIQIDRLEAINLQPGDVIVVTVPALTEPDRMADLKRQLGDYFPDHQILVKPNNLGFDIFREGDLVA